MRPLFACVGVATLCGALAGCASQEGSSQAPSLDSGLPGQQRQVEARYAYAAGVDIGRRLKDAMQEDGLKADHDLILRGVDDGLNAKPTRYPEEEMETAISQVEAVVRERRAKKQYAEDPSFRKMADENLRNSREALALAAKMDGVETLPNGLLRQVLKSGDGPYIAYAKTIKVNFTLSLADKTLVRSSEPGKPATVHLSRLPAHLVETLQEMRVGSRWKVALPPEKAYGLGGSPPVIGPNQALLLDFELVGVE